jgi:hypothetical protein
MPKTGIRHMWDQFRGRRKTCSTCAFDEIDPSLLHLYPELTCLETLKFGHLYQCSECGTYWFLKERSLIRIRDSMLPMVRIWNQMRLMIAPPLLDVLVEIGGVIDPWEEHILVPCMAEDSAGRGGPKSLVMISRHPPLFRRDYTIGWTNDLTFVEPSAVALPLDVRKASGEKREESMGFAPVGVVDRGGREYTVLSNSQFFDYRGVQGQDLQLSGRTKRWKKVVPYIESEAIFFADWFEGCEGLLAPPVSDALP